MKIKTKHSILAALSVLLLTVLDQASKYLADLTLNPANGGTDVLIWNGVFRLRYLENRGAAFGMMQGQKTILAISTILIFLVLCWVFYRLPVEAHFCALRWLITFILAGALGNFIDRMRFGYVIDFFYFELIDFPIFNVADIYVTCSVVIFLVLFLFFYTEEDLESIWPFRKRKEKEKEKEELE